MVRLNKGLLLLAKIENRQFVEKENIQIISLVQKMLNQLAARIQLKGLIISESYQDCVVESNPVLMDILLSNLLRNAIQHAIPGGSIDINILPGGLEISNSGSILPFPEEKLFQRFQKSNHPESAGGNGLGLAIVRQICDTCHYTIRYEYKDNIHSFVLDFTA